MEQNNSTQSNISQSNISQSNISQSNISQSITTPTLHLFINKFIRVSDNNFILKLDLDKTSKYTLQNILKSITSMMSISKDIEQDIINGFIRCYIPFNINLNNSEVMTTLIYKSEYNTFVIKSMTQINKIYTHEDKKYKGLNKDIINNIRKITSV